jgi:hypothetical protein
MFYTIFYYGTMIVYLGVVLKCKCIFIILIDGVRWSGGVGLHRADRGSGAQTLGRHHRDRRGSMERCISGERGELEP